MRRQLTTVIRTTTTRALAAGTLAAALAIGTAGIASADTTTATPDSSGLWAAIALGPNTGAVATAINYRSQSAASSAARSKCGQRDCRTVVTVTNGCAALAQSSTRYGEAYGRSLGATERAAENEAGRGARLLAYACSGYYTN